MRLKTWPVAAIGLATLLLLIAGSMLESSRKTQEIYAQIEALNTHYYRVDSKLRRLRSDVHLSGIFVRDYLLDISRERAPEYRQRLAEFRQTNMATVAELRALLDGHDERILSLQSKLDEYWQTFDPLFDWRPTEKIFKSASFLRREVVPKREAVLTIAQEIEELNNTNVAEQRAAVTRRHAAFRQDLDRLLWRSVSLGAAIALIFVLRLRVLEQRAEQQRLIATQAEHQMRELSQRLVATQEEERKNLSRELHDHVGQVLTALRMELGRIQRTPGPSAPGVAPAVAECRRLVDSLVRTVRDLALGLRPSMLDDFGLQAALEWHVRDFMRRYGVQVELMMDGDFTSLPDAYRTCVYRAVQEALTNCIRHAQAHAIAIRIAGLPDSLDVSIADDGIGMDVGRNGGGLGLRGIEERVRKLQGSMTIQSTRDRGTTLAFRLPLSIDETEVAIARAAG